MRTTWLILAGLLILAGCGRDSSATHRILVWDSNSESDMKEYRVYACSVTPCLGSGTPLATMVHVPTQTTHSFVLPHTDQYYVVYAVDTALNVSSPSTTAFANVTAPSAPANLRVQ